MPTSSLKDLVRNPLGIVALFIFLIYGIASLLLGLTASVLESGERYLLVSFVVVFPIVVLLAFYRLVTLHHGKLYSPGDFKDEANFFRMLTPAEDYSRLNEGVEEVILNNSGIVPNEISNEVNEPAAEIGSSRADQASHVDRPVSASSDESAVVTANMDSVGNYHARLVAEMAKKDELTKNLLSIDQNVAKLLTREYRTPVSSGVEVGGAGVKYDHAVLQNGLPIFFDVKWLPKPMLNIGTARRFVEAANRTINVLGLGVKIVLILVYDFDKSFVEVIEKQWKGYLADIPRVELRMVHRDELNNLSDD